MASFVKFQTFAYDVSKGVHNLDGTDTLKITFTNSAPDVATNTILGHISQISFTNASGTWPADIVNGATATAGTYKITGTDQVLTATGGSVGALRYTVLYNDTPTSPADPLIGYWDYGTGVTLATSETFTVDFTTSVFTVA